MKKTVLTMLLLMTSIISTFAQVEMYTTMVGEKKISKSTISFGWNKALGVGVGYTKVYKDFDTQYEGVSAPQDLVHFDLTVYGVYLGADFMVKSTGYDVYGYDEQLGTWALKFGPSFKINKKTSKWKCILTPYIGTVFYSLSDASNNAIGARDDYGKKESQFLYGGRASIVYDWCYLGFHGSNRELGITFGVEFDL